MQVRVRDLIYGTPNKNMDRTFDDYNYWKILNESIIKTDGYLERLDRFNRFKDEYMSD